MSEIDYREHGRRAIRDKTASAIAMDAKATSEPGN